MFLSRDEEAVKKVRFWATQARDPAPHYQHSEIGYNYRMSNIVAGMPSWLIDIRYARMRCRSSENLTIMQLRAVLYRYRR